ncbi:MAG TPA: DUF885 domain-containing protein [Kofleriaceae bacterium]|jgi:uncharacterized protein (DUF885 family)|nr:DUF885 domain-containing protein [Kofleriaceae bacterium]
MDPQPRSSSSSPLAADAVAGVTDPALRAVVAEHWDHTMRWAPTWATTLGDHRFDDRLAPRDAASIARANAERDALLARLVALDPAALGDADRMTLALLRGHLEAQHAVEVCRFHEWNVDSANASLFGELSYLVEGHTVHAAHDAANLVARLRQGPRLIDDTIANLRIGLADGRVASAEKLRRAIEQLDRELARPADAWAMAHPKWAAAPSPDPWPAGERDRQLHALREVVAGQIHPAFVRLRDFLRDVALPRARGEREGLASLPDGDACYRAAILLHVGLAKSPEELHALGLAEIARTDREIAALGASVLHTPDLAATIARLRTDPALYFATRDELLAAAQRALDRAKAAVPRFFSVLPRTDCVMRETPAYEAPYSTIAYYRQPHYDGSKPGEYFVNTYRPETRPRYELEALTWHESIPGHHLQIALAQELGALPLFRKLDGSTAFVEGWALYTERLADEMGLYSSDLDRLGKLSYDAWRASRLVVDTGIHALGWTRAQAEAFMRAHTALTEVNISNEVDRYIGWPGQALAYKVGQLEILALRREAEVALGARFQLPAFHAVVLGAGAVTLPVLRDRVHGWIATVAGR